MLSGYAKLQRSPLVVTCVGLLFALLSCSEAVAQPRVGRIIGNLDGISQDGDFFFISGWACQQGRKDSIQIHIYAADPNDPGKRVFVTANRANFENEPAVNQRCQDREEGKHRFLVPLPFGYGRDSKLFVHGIRVVNGVLNEAIGGSGLPMRDLGVPWMTFPNPTVPPISGSYRALDEHPRVFMTAGEIKDIVSRINRPGSYSAKRFGWLTRQIAQDLASRIDWDATYSGCDDVGKGGVYLQGFSYEPPPGYGTALNESQLDAAMHVPVGQLAPDGAAVVASRLALYAALVKAGAVVPKGSPEPGQAAVLAKRILLAWADRGFPRDSSGSFQSLTALSRDKCTGWVSGLHLGRGTVYSVHAQDLLQSLGALNASEVSRLNALHSALFDWIRWSLNQFAGFSQPACQRYANGTANALAALLAIAHLFDDPHRFNAVLLGNDRSIPVTLPWTRYFDAAIYGESDHPMDCYPNAGPDSLHSVSGGFTTPDVAAGEVQDRYRGGILQTFGYPMFTLERLINSAEILHHAGFDPYGYRGNHKQSIEMAVQYYACYGKTPGFYKTVMLDNARDCPNYAQYYGKVVNAVDPNIIFGSYRYPENQAIRSAEDAAKAVPFSRWYSNETILFGKWRD